MRFLKYRYLYFFLSLLVIVPGLYSLIRWGLKPSIDFTGGTILELENLKIQDLNKFSDIIKNENSELVSLQTSGQNGYLLRLKEINKEQKETILKKIKENYGEAEEVRFETVGPTLGKELLIKTLVAVFLAAGFILLYIALSFKDKKYGVCAVLAMFHDTLVLLGIFSLLGHFKNVEVDTLFVTALLTILSFSVHDTVVVFNKIRESIRRNPELPLESLIDKAITETLARSLNNSLTIIFMLLVLYLLGGETTKWFSFTLLIGTISGTYSSSFNAAPLLLVYEEIFRKKKIS